MKRTILLSLFALLLAPAFAVAAEASAPLIESSGCDSALSFLAAAPVTPAGNDAATLIRLEGMIEVQSSSCCQTALRMCRRNCACGVFEFNCDPATCQSSCICNICP